MLRLLDLLIDLAICLFATSIYAFFHGYTRLVSMWAQW